MATSAFIVAVQGSVAPLAAAGQALGATIATAAGAFLLRRIANFDPGLSRLRDAIGLIVLGAFGSALVSASIGIASLYAAGVQPYSGIGSAWLIYWLGDGTGMLLVTPLVFTLPGLLRIRPPMRIAELIAFLTLLTVACFVVFGDLSLIPIQLHVLAFGILPFVMWGAIRFGIGGAALSVFFVATIATLLTALGSGPFAGNTPFINAVLLDVLFIVLAVSGLPLAAVVAEQQHAESEKQQLVREQVAMEARVRLAAIVESSDDAIFSESLGGVITSWNAAAHRIFGFTEAEAVGQPVTILIPPEQRDEEQIILQKLRAGERTAHLETIRRTKTGEKVNVSLSVSPLRDAAGNLVGAAKVIRNITEQKRAEEALSTVNRRLIDAQEQERARIARELHDDIAQRLALLTVELASLANEAPASLAVQRQMVAIQNQASDLAGDVQALSHELHSSKLELLGIAEGMRLFCKEFADQQNARVDFSTCDLPRELPSDISLSLFRVTAGSPAQFVET